MKRIKERHEKRNVPKSLPLGPARAAFEDLHLNVTALTTDLNLTGVELPDRSLAALWTLLCESTALESIRLQRCGVRTVHAAGLRAALAHNGTLTALNLRNNALGDAGVEVLLADSPPATSAFPLPQASGHSLPLSGLCGGKCRDLDLRSNGLTSQASAVLFAAACRHENKATAVSAATKTASLFDALCGIPTEQLLSGTLSSLRLPSMGLGPAEGGLLGAILAVAPAAVTGDLDLSWNSDLGAEGGRALAEALLQCASPVRSLTLCGCRLCDVDERGRSFVVRNECYSGGSEEVLFDNEHPRSEPVALLSTFRSDAIVALSFLLRSGRGIGLSLAELVLDDNCLCPQPDMCRAAAETNREILGDDKRSEDEKREEERGGYGDFNGGDDDDAPSFFEWQHPPDAFSRDPVQGVEDGKTVRACVTVPGCGSRWVRCAPFSLSCRIVRRKRSFLCMNPLLLFSPFFRFVASGRCGTSEAWRTQSAPS